MKYGRADGIQDVPAVLERLRIAPTDQDCFASSRLATLRPTSLVEVPKGRRSGPTQFSFCRTYQMTGSAGVEVGTDGCNMAGLRGRRHSLAQCIAEIRRGLGRNSQPFIEAVAKRGYTFDVRVISPLRYREIYLASDELVQAISSVQIRRVALPANPVKPVSVVSCAGPILSFPHCKFPAV
jgi:hypothetical protein